MDFTVIGKTIIKKAIASPQICSKLSALGKEVPFDENKLSEMEEFVLECVYGEKKYEIFQHMQSQMLE